MFLIESRPAMRPPPDKPKGGIILVSSSSSNKFEGGKEEESRIVGVGSLVRRVMLRGHAWGSTRLHGNHTRFYFGRDRGALIGYEDRNAWHSHVKENFKSDI
jgi:hypothetical protein